jgi:hypothetical protein
MRNSLGGFGTVVAVVAFAAVLAGSAAQGQSPVGASGGPIWGTETPSPVSAAAAQPPCPPPPCPTGCPPPREPVKSLCPDEHDFFLLPPRCPWYTATDGIAIRRDVHRELDVATLNTPGRVMLSTRDLDFGFSAGARTLVGHTLNECFQIEGLYFSLTEWDRSAAIRNDTDNALGGKGNLFSPLTNFGSPAVSGLDYNKLVAIGYRASLDNAELYIRRALPMPPEKLSASILVGARYMSLPEEFTYYAQSAVPAPQGAVNEISVRTDNDLVGPQIGALFECYIENRWWINVEIKGALCNNRTEQSTRYRNVNADGVESIYFGHRAEDNTAFVGDLALTFLYRWSPFFTTRIGYQAIWLENLAIASDNLNRDVNILREGPAQLVHDGRGVFHGPHAGIMLTW